MTESVHDVAVSADGLLRAFSEYGVLTWGDVHPAQHVSFLYGETDDRVRLALAGRRGSIAGQRGPARRPLGPRHRRRARLPIRARRATGGLLRPHGRNDRSRDDERPDDEREPEEHEAQPTPRPRVPIEDSLRHACSPSAAVACARSPSTR